MFCFYSFMKPGILSLNVTELMSLLKQDGRKGDELQDFSVNCLKINNSQKQPECNHISTTT